MTCTAHVWTFRVLPAAAVYRPRFLSDTTYTYGARHLLNPIDDLRAEEEANTIIVRVGRCSIVAREVGGAAGGT